MGDYSPDAVETMFGWTMGGPAMSNNVLSYRERERISISFQQQSAAHDSDSYLPAEFVANGTLIMSHFSEDRVAYEKMKNTVKLTNNYF